MSNQFKKVNSTYVVVENTNQIVRPLKEGESVIWNNNGTNNAKISTAPNSNFDSLPMYADVSKVSAERSSVRNTVQYVNKAGQLVSGSMGNAKVEGGDLITTADANAQVESQLTTPLIILGDAQGPEEGIDTDHYLVVSSFAQTYREPVTAIQAGYVANGKELLSDTSSNDSKGIYYPVSFAFEDVIKPKYQVYGGSCGGWALGIQSLGWAQINAAFNLYYTNAPSGLSSIALYNTSSKPIMGRILIRRRYDGGTLYESDINEDASHITHSVPFMLAPNDQISSMCRNVTNCLYSDTVYAQGSYYVLAYPYKIQLSVGTSYFYDGRTNPAVKSGYYVFLNRINHHRYLSDNEGDYGNLNTQTVDWDSNSTGFKLELFGGN